MDIWGFSPLANYDNPMTLYIQVSMWTHVLTSFKNIRKLGKSLLSLSNFFFFFSLFETGFLYIALAVLKFTL